MMEALLQINKLVKDAAADKPFFGNRLLIIASSVAEAACVARKVKSAGVECKVLSGYPTRAFRERYWHQAHMRPGLLAVVATHSRGKWEFWPDQVIAFNPPKLLLDHTRVEMLEGKTTWTFFKHRKRASRWRLN